MSDPGATPAADGFVFISHSSRDRQMAHTISAALENRGFRCWISSRDIGPGENFQEAIVHAIRTSRVMVLVFTGNANNSDEIKKEMALASQSKLAVIPIRVEDVVPNDAFAYEFATRQWIDTFGNWEQAIERLSHQISTVVPAAAQPGPQAAPASTSAAAPAPRRTGTLIGAALVILLAAAGAYVAFKPAPQSPPAPQAAAPPPAPAPQAAQPPAPVPPPAASPPAEAGSLQFVAEAYRAYRNENYERSFRLFEQAASQGIPAGEYGIGNMYQQGLGTTRDVAKAMEWYRKAADHGSAQALAGIGALYRQGQGVPRDFGAARRWFQQAADKGSPRGFVGLGNLARNGEGMPRDFAEAMRDFQRAVDLNAPDAGYFLGLMYERGEGVPADPAQTRAWMNRAAEGGSPEAKKWLREH